VDWLVLNPLDRAAEHLLAKRWLQMNEPEVLTRWLRCPLNPSAAVALTYAEDRLLCSACQVGFLIRDGIPNLVVDEAVLPTGCGRIEQLPCQRAENSGR
jgi:hypothetical protein